VGRVPFSGANASIQAAYKQVEIEKAEFFLKDYQEVCRRKNVSSLAWFSQLVTRSRKRRTTISFF
jgi:hypothetical protein